MLEEFYENLNLDKEILDALYEFNIINESVYEDVLLEASKFEGDLLLEGKTEDTLTVHGVVVNYHAFMAAYTDPAKYPEREDVLKALGFDVDFLDDKGKANAIDRIRSHFNKVRVEHFEDPIVGFKDRQQRYSARGKLEAQKRLEQGDDPWVEIEPDKNDIFGGNRSTRNRATRTTDAINSRNVLDGELYSNMTRIKPSRWDGWLRFFRRQQKFPVKYDYNLISRSWKKLFILGYQVERNILHEIWYNTIDSTFSIHDINGVETSTRAKTIQEAIRYLMNHITQVSRHDSAFFRTGQGQEIIQSVMTGIRGTYDPRIEELDRLSKAEIDKEQKKIEDTKRKKEEARIARDRRIEAAKRTLKNVGANALSSAKREDTHDPEKEKREIEKRAEELRNAERDINSDTRRLNIRVNFFLKKDFDSKEKFNKEEESIRNDILDTIKKYEQIFNSEGGHHRIADLRVMIKKLGDQHTVFNNKFSDMEAKEVTTRMELRSEMITASRQLNYQIGVFSETVFKNRKEMEDAKQSLMKQAKDIEHTVMLKVKDDALLAQVKEVTNRLRDTVGKVVSKSTPPPTNTTPQRQDRIRKIKDSLGDMLGDNVILTEDELLEEQKALMEQFASELSKFDNDDDVTPGDAYSEIVDDKSFDTKIKSMRSALNSDKYTQTAIEQSVNSDLITIYHETRAPAFIKVLEKFLNIFRGRKDPILLPTTKRPNVFKRIGMKFTGNRYSADFMIGYSLANKVNFEIWYITEPNPDYVKGAGNKKVISSFYVFDVTSKRLIRAYIPYYRNAIQLIMAKIGTIS